MELVADMIEHQFTQSLVQLGVQLPSLSCSDEELNQTDTILQSPSFIKVSARLMKAKVIVSALSLRTLEITRLASGKRKHVTVNPIIIHDKSKSEKRIKLNDTSLTFNDEILSIKDDANQKPSLFTHEPKITRKVKEESPVSKDNTFIASLDDQNSNISYSDYSDTEKIEPSKKNRPGQRQRRE